MYSSYGLHMVQISEHSYSCLNIMFFQKIMNSLWMNCLMYVSVTAAPNGKIIIQLEHNLMWERLSLKIIKVFTPEISSTNHDLTALIPENASWLEEKHCNILNSENHYTRWHVMKSTATSRHIDLKDNKKNNSHTKIQFTEFEVYSIMKTELYYNLRI